MKEIVNFLQALSENNNRDWFNQHKSEYQECKRQFDKFVELLLLNIRNFDDSIGQLTLSECTYRIYRDTRFSSDKTPYKTHFGAFIVPGGKKSGYSGYYFQVGANDKGFPGGCMLATGNYYVEPKVLRIMREDISLDAEYFDKIVNQAKDFYLDFDGALKRIPSGYDINTKYSDYLRLRNFCLVKDAGLKYMLQPDLLHRVIEDFKTTKDFLSFTNRAISFSRSES